MVTCWERAGPLAPLYVMFSVFFITFQCGALDQARYLVVSIPNVCRFAYFDEGSLFPGIVRQQSLA